MFDDINALRDLLGLVDRDVAAATMLQGIVETTEFGAMQREWAPTDDVAVVFVGPRGLLHIERREGEHGSFVYTVTLKPSLEGGPDVRPAA